MQSEPSLRLRKLSRAKTYIDDMRMGLDPVSGQPVPDDSFIRQEKIANCFAFISEILGELLEEGIPVPQEAVYPELMPAEKTPFRLLEEQKTRVRVSSAPVAVSTFVGRLNGVLNRQTTKNVRAKDINGWLTAKGFIEERRVQVVKEEKE